MRTAAIWVFGLLASLVIGSGLLMLWMAPPMSIESCRPENIGSERTKN